MKTLQCDNTILRANTHFAMKELKKRQFDHLIYWEPTCYKSGHSWKNTCRSSSYFSVPSQGGSRMNQQHCTRNTWPIRCRWTSCSGPPFQLPLQLEDNECPTQSEFDAEEQESLWKRHKFLKKRKKTLISFGQPCQFLTKDDNLVRNC